MSRPPQYGAAQPLASPGWMERDNAMQWGLRPDPPHGIPGDTAEPTS